MLKQDVYERISSEFGAPVGVAHILNHIDIRKIENKVEKRVSSKEWEFNRIITNWVDEGEYQSNWRRVWEYKRKHPRMSIHNVYKKVNSNEDRA
jgi:hypothetical protein